jgi:hypothetical protein
MSVEAMPIEGLMGRDRDVEEAVPGAGPVQCGGLLDIDRDGGQARQEDDHDHPRRLPGHHDQDGPQGEVGIGQPDPGLHPEPADRLVQRSLEVEDELPDVGDRQRAEHHRHEEEDSEQVPRLERPVECEGQQKPEDVGGDQEADR